MNIREAWNNFRENLRKAPATSVVDIASRNNLAIEYADWINARKGASLDWNDPPRFIAVCPILPPPEENYFIARELGRYQQVCRMNSFIMNSPKKWKLLDAAPSQIRERLYELDLEMRAHLLMIFFVKPGHYSNFLKRNPKKNRESYFLAINSNFLFLKLRVRNFFYDISCPFRAILKT
jgi:hypothetical protein